MCVAILCYHACAHSAFTVWETLFPPGCSIQILPMSKIKSLSNLANLLLPFWSFNHQPWHFDLSPPSQGYSLVTLAAPHRSCLWTSLILTGCPLVKLFFKLPSVRGSPHLERALVLEPMGWLFTMGSLKWVLNVSELQLLPLKKL